MKAMRIDRLDDPRLADLSEHVRWRITAPQELLCRGRPACRRPSPRERSSQSNRFSSTTRRSGLSRRHCRAVPQDVPIYVCDTHDFAAITGFNLHRGCLALAQRPMERPLADRDRRRRSDLWRSRPCPTPTTSEARSATPPPSARASFSTTRVAIRCIARRFARRWEACCESVRACGRLAERSAGTEA